MPNLKLLHQRGEEDEKLFLSQRLPEAKAFSECKWNNSLIVDVLSIFINESGWVKPIRVLEQLGIMHGMVKAGHHCCALGNGVPAYLDLFQGMVGNSKVNQASYPETFEYNSACVGHVFFVA